jgi:hypothetical protein
MLVALLNKISGLRARLARRTSSSPAKADIPTPQSAYAQRTAQHEFKGIQSDAFFFVRASEDPQLRRSHPDGSSCGAGCGSS